MSASLASASDLILLKFSAKQASRGLRYNISKLSVLNGQGRVAVSGVIWARNSSEQRQVSPQVEAAPPV